jgi:hypothetical protein
MANKMGEVHVTVAGVVAHNPGQHPLPAGAGQPVVATGKPQDKTAVVSGQIANSSVIIKNPA